MQKTIAIFIQRCKKRVAWMACYFFTICAILGTFTQSVLIPILGTFVLFTVLIFQGNSVLVQNFRFLHGDRNFINKFSLNLKSRIEMWKHEHNTKLRLQSKWGRLGVEMLFNSGKTRASRLLHRWWADLSDSDGARLANGFCLAGPAALQTECRDCRQRGLLWTTLLVYDAPMTEVRTCVIIDVWIVF